MKTSREQLKALMKELLIEILSEGLGNVPARRPTAPGRSSIAGVVESAHRSNVRRRPEFDHRLDSPLGQGRRPSDELKEAVRRESGGNPILADILADTAMTTLPNQMAAGDPMGGGGYAPPQQEQFHGDVAAVFGEGGQVRDDGNSHWADLAFMSSKKPL